MNVLLLSMSFQLAVFNRLLFQLVSGQLRPRKTPLDKRQVKSSYQGWLTFDVTKEVKTTVAGWSLKSSSVVENYKRYQVFFVTVETSGGKSSCRTDILQLITRVNAKVQEETPDVVECFKYVENIFN